MSANLLEKDTAKEEHQHQIGNFAFCVTELEFKQKDLLPPAEVARFAREMFSKEIEDVTLEDIKKLNEIRSQYATTEYLVENVIGSIFWVLYYINYINPNNEEVVEALSRNITGRQTRLIKEEMNYEE